MSKITQLDQIPPRLRKSGIRAKLWPNGEIAFYEPRERPEKPDIHLIRIDWRDIMLWWLMVTKARWPMVGPWALGLSNVTNSDKSLNPPPQYGLRGITPLGRRRVRNACYLLTREVGKHRLTFSTVTVPPMPDEDMALIHENWHKVIEMYRLQMIRQLRRGGLSGEIFGVTEIQEGRYEKDGFPVLHAHFVFVGKTRSGGWIISPRLHDLFWNRAIRSVIGRTYGPMPSACRLENPKKSVEGYLGKYISKGVKALESVIANGWEWVLPKQWWNCSRSLVVKMEEKIRQFSDGVPWLLVKANEKGNTAFQYFGIVEIEKPDGDKIAMGAYGRLTPHFNGVVRKVLKLQHLHQCDTLNLPTHSAG